MTSVGLVLRSRLLRDISLVGGGAAVGQAITLAITPFLTRLYSPIDYGQASIFLAIVTVLVPTLTLTLPHAIVLPRTDHEARHLARVSLIFAASGGVILALLGLAFAEPVARITGFTDPTTFLWLLVPATITGALQLIGQQWLVRQRAYRVGAMATVGGATLGATIRATLGWLSPMPLGLVLGAIGNYVAQALPALGAKGAFGWAGTSSRRSMRTRIGYIVRRYDDFIRYRMPQLLLNTGSAAMPVMALGLVDPRSAGFFALAKSVVDAPTMLVGKAVTDVMNPRIVQTVRNRRLIAPMLVKSTAAMALIALPAYAAIFFYGKELFALVFGDAWEGAGQHASWMAIWMFFGFANRPTVTAAAPLEIQHGLLVYEILTTIGKVIALYVGIAVLHDELHAVALFCLTGAASYLGLIIWILIEAWRHDREVERKYA